MSVAVVQSETPRCTRPAIRGLCLVVLPINKLHGRLAPRQDVQAPKRDCPECLSQPAGRSADLDRARR
ncbi:hypothetical protein B1R27_24025 [Streptomyces sp. GKU 895]|nr:hypothetical protein B1R27_24025 [Streptomyces sp. GKU 895]